MGEETLARHIKIVAEAIADAVYNLSSVRQAVRTSSLEVMHGTQSNL